MRPYPSAAMRKLLVVLPNLRNPVVSRSGEHVARGRAATVTGVPRTVVRLRANFRAADSANPRRDARTSRHATPATPAPRDARNACAQLPPRHCDSRGARRPTRSGRRSAQPQPRSQRKRGNVDYSRNRAPTTNRRPSEMALCCTYPVEPAIPRPTSVGIGGGSSSNALTTLPKNSHEPFALSSV